MSNSAYGKGSSCRGLEENMGQLQENTQNKTHIQHWQRTIVRGEPGVEKVNSRINGVAGDAPSTPW